jgi:hypothetical protein
VEPVEFNPICAQLGIVLIWTNNLGRLDRVARCHLDGDMSIGRRTFLGGTAAAAVLGTAGTANARQVNRRVRLGLNYTPSKNWWYTWSDWDTASIGADLADIRALGMDHIRIMGLWPELQPNRTYVRAEMVDRVRVMLDMAGRHGLDVEVTVLDGAVSGFLFVPPWLLNNGNGALTNFFTDPDAIAAQQALFAALGKAVGRHPRFLGFDLSNEIYWFAQPFGVTVDPPVGDTWLRTMFDAAASAAPGRCTWPASTTCRGSTTPTSAGTRSPRPDR